MKKMLKRFFAIALACAGFLAAPSAAQDNYNQAPEIFQVSTLHALNEGAYDGDTTFGELKKRGDFGLGTLNGMDGEMLGFGGDFYQITSDGAVHQVPDAAQTPFAAVTFFRPKMIADVRGPLDYAGLKAALETLMPRKDRIYAIRADAILRKIKVRSVSRQTPPYPTLQDVVKGQAVRELENVQGTLVGFWFPEYLGNLNEAGFHLHFLDSQRKAGGHVLEMLLDAASVRVQGSRGYSLRLPEK